MEWPLLGLVSVPEGETHLASRVHLDSLADRQPVGTDGARLEADPVRRDKE